MTNFVTFAKCLFSTFSALSKNEFSTASNQLKDAELWKTLWKVCKTLQNNGNSGVGFRHEVWKTLFLVGEKWENFVEKPAKELSRGFCEKVQNLRFSQECCSFRPKSQSVSLCRARWHMLWIAAPVRWRKMPMKNLPRFCLERGCFWANYGCKGCRPYTAMGVSFVPLPEGGSERP